MFYAVSRSALALCVRISRCSGVSPIEGANEPRSGVARESATERLAKLGYLPDDPVRLTPEGLGMYRFRGGVITGRIVSVTPGGLLRVRVDGYAWAETFHPRYWELIPGADTT
jgi:hypothetical protein